MVERLNTFLLGAMPDAQDRYRVLAGDTINDDVGPDRDQFAGPGLTTGPATARKRHQTVPATSSSRATLAAATGLSAAM